MRDKFRIYMEIEKGFSPFKKWTFDHPKQVSVGYTPDSDLWLLDGKAEARRVVFFQKGGELRLRVFPDLEGALQIEKREISLRTLREAGLFKVDRQGEYLPLQAQSSGRLTFGQSVLRFWVTPEPKEPDFPLHPAWLRLLKAVPVPFCLAFILGFFVDIWFVNFLASLPPQPALTIHEVSRKFARISIPKKNYVEKKYGALGKPREYKPKLKKVEKATPSGGPSPAVRGFLSATMARGKAKGGTPFDSLFTTESLAADLGAQMGGGSMDKLLSKSLRTLERTGPGTGSSTMGIGSVRGEGLNKGALNRQASRPVVSRLSATLPRGGSQVNRSALEQAVASREGEVRTCYEQALNRNPRLSGKVVIQLKISADGQAANVGVAQSNMSDRGFHRCLVRQISSWTFPATGSLTEMVHLPFVFSSSAQG